jgi:hypothetical protein
MDKLLNSQMVLDSLPYTETYEGGHKYHFTGNCKITGEERTVTVPGQELFRFRAGDMIQVAMKSVSTDDREFLISGISPAGWYRLNNAQDNDTDK